jgi:hypothetical protein
MPLIVAAVACLAGSADVLLLTGSAKTGWIIVVTLIGTASGLFRTFGYIGSIAFSAIIAITFHADVSDGGLHITALIMRAVSALALANYGGPLTSHAPGPGQTASESASAPARQPTGQKRS